MRSCFNGLYSFNKKLPNSGIKSEIISNQELAEELHKPIFRRVEKQKLDSSL